MLVAIFLLVFYRFLGLVAVAGLAIYAAFLYATILAFNVTLTLPGFAGLVLTFGVAADANIVIFERIKEEVRAGSSVRAAVSQGYRRASTRSSTRTSSPRSRPRPLRGRHRERSWVRADAPHRHGALDAHRGPRDACDPRCARGFQWFNNPRLMGATGQGIARWLRIDFMGKRRIWFAISGPCRPVSIVAIAVRG